MKNSGHLEFDDIHFLEFEGHRIRFVGIDGERWFSGKDVVSIWTFSNSTQDFYLKNLPEEEKRIFLVPHSLGGLRSSQFLSVRGVHSLCNQSVRPKAKEFHEYFGQMIAKLQNRKTAKPTHEITE